MKNRMLGLIGIMALLSLGMNCFLWSRVERTAYINNTRIFQEFSGTKELDARLAKGDDKRKNALDSLTLGLTLLASRLQDDPGNKELENAYRQKKGFVDRVTREYEYERNMRTTEYTEQIWTQINGYVTEFGEEEGYDYIHGAAGNGSLMYGSEKKDITEEVIAFINRKYEGF